MANFIKTFAPLTLDEDDLEWRIRRSTVDGVRVMFVTIVADGYKPREYKLADLPGVGASKTLAAHLRACARQYLADEGFAQA